MFMWQILGRLINFSIQMKELMVLLIGTPTIFFVHPTIYRRELVDGDY